jgi:hypothetical protein
VIEKGSIGGRQLDAASCARYQLRTNLFGG